MQSLPPDVGPAPDVPPAPAPAPAPARATRRSRPGRDMVISLVVLLIPLAVVVALYRLRGNEDVPTVDPAPKISQAAAAFPVAEPGALPVGWQCVAAVVQHEASGVTLRIGYVAPDGGALQLVESTEAHDALLIRELGDQTRANPGVGISGTTWRSFDVRTDERALVRADDGRTIIVVGKASPTDLQTLAGALRPG